MELNSNELIWAMLKGKVARSNLTFKKDTDTASDCDGGSTPTASEGHEASGNFIVMLKKYNTIQQKKNTQKIKTNKQYAKNNKKAHENIHPQKVNVEKTL